jgi:hypothetical protein
LIECSHKSEFRENAKAKRTTQKLRQKTFMQINPATLIVRDEMIAQVEYPIVPVSSKLATLPAVESLSPALAPSTSAERSRMLWNTTK